MTEEEREGKKDETKRVKKGRKNQTEGRECEGRRGGRGGEDSVSGEGNAYAAYEMKTNARVGNRKRQGRIETVGRRKNNDDK